MTPAELTQAGERLFPGLLWSQPNDFARLLGVPHRTLYNWKIGRRRVPRVGAAFIRHLLAEHRVTP